MIKDNLHFEMSHLNRYAIINKPCTIIVKNNSKVSVSDMYTTDGHNRWILNLMVISEFNLTLLKTLTSSNVKLSYRDVGHLLMTGVIWEDQVHLDSDLPSKGEELIAVFDYVEDVLRCTNITLIPRRQPDIYLHSSEVANEIEEFENIIRKMRDE